MESIHLRTTSLPNKRLPIRLTPQRAPVYAYATASASASARKKSKKTVAQAVERRRPEMAAELEQELQEEGYWEWREMENCRECGEEEEDGGNGMVELMECLEREAIMGENEGKHPNDYNRRAHIFDKSSKIFQALKQPQMDTNPEHSS